MLLMLLLPPLLPLLHQLLLPPVTWVAQSNIYMANQPVTSLRTLGVPYSKQRTLAQRPPATLSCVYATLIYQQRFVFKLCCVLGAWLLTENPKAAQP
jgi:hypothetical protein